MSGAETREEILAVSARLFETHGIGGTTVRAIAAGCSIEAASLYNHFASKDEIVAEVLSRSSAFAEQQYAEIRSADLAPLARIEALMRATVLSFRVHPEASRTFFENPAYVASAPLLKAVRAVARSIDAMWTQAIEEAVRGGVVRDDIAPGVLWSLLRDMMLATSRANDAARSDDVVRILMRGIASGTSGSVRTRRSGEK